MRKYKVEIKGIKYDIRAGTTYEANVIAKHLIYHLGGSELADLDEFLKVDKICVNRSTSKFEVGQVYESCGKLYKVTKRTDKSVWFINSPYAHPKRSLIRHSSLGNEVADVETNWRSVTAGSFGDEGVKDRVNKSMGYEW